MLGDETRGAQLLPPYMHGDTIALAPWRALSKGVSEYLLSISDRSPLATLGGFHPDTIKTDLQHNVMLGHGPLACGSALVSLIEVGLFGTAGIPDQKLTTARNRFRGRAKSKCWEHTEPVWTRMRLSWKKGDYLSLHFTKAHNCRVVIALCADMAYE